MSEELSLKFFCDKNRHLICLPYTVDNLHVMADIFQIKRCWFHKHPYPHYDIPKKRINEFLNRENVDVISSKNIIRIIRNEYDKFEKTAKEN